jgi:hypothetical protein
MEFGHAGHPLTAELIERRLRETARTAQRRKPRKRRARVRKTAHTAQRREMPNSANCPTAQTAREREVPNGGNDADIERRELPKAVSYPMARTDGYRHVTFVIRNG